MNTSIGFDEATLIANLRELWGYDDFREGQLSVITQVMSGQDTLALMPTGAGKSLCYQLPAMLLPGLTLVISPLIALMKDQYDNLPAGVYQRSTFINSSLETNELERRLDEMIAGRYKLVYAAPERLRQRPFLDALKRAGLRLLVIDEAHCVSLWGHDFRPDYLFIRKALPLLGDPQLLGLTATATPQMQREIGDQLGRKLTPVLLSSFRPNLRYEVKRASNAEGKMRLLVELCKAERGSGIVYATSRDNCEKLARLLHRQGVKAEYYHAGLDSAERSAVQERFMLDRTRVIVATVAFGMGIDKANVRFIAHYNMPKSLESYAQESGRAGRDGKPARCVLFYSSADKGNLTRWARGDQLDKPTLRAVYKAVRDALADGVRQEDGSISGLVVSGDLVREVNAAGVGDVDDTKLRVAISLLERAALLRRHLDAPRTATLLLNGPMFGANEQDEQFARFCQQARLRPGEREVIEVLAVARQMALGPDELEARLLDWQAGGLLQYRGGGRDMVLSLMPNPANAAAQIDQLLGQLDRAMEQRLSQMEAYAEASICRHQAIARHLGENLPPCGDACDVCAASGEALTPWEDGYAAPVANVGAAIMECVHSLPVNLGRTGLAQALVGSIAASVQADRCANFGRLAYAARKDVTAAIDTLLEAGYLRLFSKGEYPLLTLGPRGHETPPADLISLRAKNQPKPPRSGDRQQQDAATWQVALATSQAPNATELDDEAADLFERLRAWRRSAAQHQNVPPYVIAHDSLLRNIAQARPRNIATLASIYGVGEKRAANYGAEILDLLWEDDGHTDPSAANYQRGANSVAPPTAGANSVASSISGVNNAAPPASEADYAVPTGSSPTSNPAQAIIDCVRSLPTTVNIDELSYILIGSVAAVIKPNRCRNHGVFAMSMTGEVKGAIIALADDGYLSLTEGQIKPLVGLGPRASQSPPANLIVVHTNPKAGMNRDVALEGRLDVPDEDEFTAEQKSAYLKLKNWRQQVSQRERGRLTNVVSSATLRSIAALHPRTIEELTHAYGMDQEKLEKYGTEVLAVLWGDSDSHPLPTSPSSGGEKANPSPFDNAQVGERIDEVVKQ